jgi:ABC-type sugar transport system substrate-binding protein
MPASRSVRLAVITKNKANPAYAGARLGVDRLAARYGSTVRHYVPDTPDSIDEQRELIEAAIADRPDAIALVPAHASALDDTLRRAEAAGIPLFGFVNPLANIRCVTFAGSNDRALGEAIAERLFDHIGGKGDIAIMEGSPNAPTAVARHEGFRNVLRRRPAVREIAATRGDFHKEPARRAMAALLEAHPRIDGVLVANDLMAMGVIDALREARRTMPIVSVNATPDGVAAIKRGDMLATAAFDAMRMACTAVHAAHRHLTGQAVPSEIILPVEVVDAQNYARWDRDYPDRPLPEWDEVVGTAKGIA